MPKLVIDGEELEVPAGTSILDAALSRGIEIPHYCYHPALSTAGNCRMCLVEVEKMPKLVISCATTVGDGMVVHTHSEKVREAQRAVMEFLLINHPLDCPICDQAGECKLQDYSTAYGHGVSRYNEPKLSLAKAVDVGRYIMLDQERCIQCSRCIRFCDEITQTGELSFFQRGNRSQIGVFPGKRLDNPYSGNVVDLCPVGALTLKDFRFTNRVWFLENTPSICAGCARGCNVLIAVGTKQARMTSRGQLDDRIKRLVPRENTAVNGYWMCDEGRHSFNALQAAPRLESAQMPPGRDEEWDSVIEAAAGQLKAAAEAGRVAAILSPRLTSETLFGFRTLFDGLGLDRVELGVRRIERGEDDELLIRADKGANSRGAAWIFGEQADEAAVLEAVRRGEVDTLLVVEDPLDPQAGVVLDAEAREKLQHLIHVGPFSGAANEQATLALPMAAWSEEDGTYVNFEGRVQRVRRSHLPRGEGRPGWRVAADLLRAVEGEAPEWSTAAEVLADLAAKVTEYEGLTEEKVGLLGVPGHASAPAGA